MSGTQLASKEKPSASANARPPARVRMTGQERREQLLDVGRVLFAEKGFEPTSIEEIAERAKISKPIVYEHFGGKQGLYAVIVDREVQELLGRITAALDAEHPRVMLQQAAQAFLAYIEEEPEGFRILVRDTPAASGMGTLGSLLHDIASQVDHILAEQFKARGYDPKMAPVYARALVGMVAVVGEWWLDVGKPGRDAVAAHIVNLAWNGLSDLEKKPGLVKG
jgi:AcrR family transcriptional regulator